MNAAEEPKAQAQKPASSQVLIDQATRKETSPFDFLIIGSGAGGGPLACRLALGGKKVLLIEAGKDPRVAGVVHDAPLFHAAATEEPELSWQFSVRHYKDEDRQKNDHKYDPARDPSQSPQPGAPSQARGKGGIFYPRSSGIGGCTGHHAMIVIRPNDSDWEYIADLTNDDTWRAKNMQPYFAQFEKCLYLDEYRGAFLKFFGVFYKGLLALMRLINPRSVLDEGGHGREGWQPTSLISPMLIKRIIATDAQFTRVLIQSAFKTIEKSTRLTAWLKRILVTLGIVRSFDPNDVRTRAAHPDGGVFLIPTGTGSYTCKCKGKCHCKCGKDLVDENGVSLKGKRAGLREFILKTQKELESNPDKEHSGRLVIAQGVHVTRVLFDDDAAPPRAIGVAGVRGDHLYQASPNCQGRGGQPVEFFVRHGKDKQDHDEEATDPTGEVILCGGAFNTPQLLMLSGIGDYKHLREIQAHTRRKKGDPPIKLRANLLGVGKNLQDRYEIGLVSELREDLKSLDTLQFDPNSTTDKLLAEWRNKKEGLYTSNGGALAILQRSKTAESPQPDLFTFGVPAAFRGYYWNWSKELLRPYKGAVLDQRNLWTWVVLKAYTRNNGGTVRLRSDDPFEVPDICFHSFDDGATKDWEKDVEALVEAVESLRAIHRVSGSPFVNELQPAAYLDQANALRRAQGLPDWTVRDWIKNEAWGHHACGTCRIGSDPWQACTDDLSDKEAVLASDFRVHGVEGLRVVDASVFPKIPGYFILAPIFMVSEKAARTILDEGIDDSYPARISAFEQAAIATRRARAWVDKDNKFIPAQKRTAPAAEPSGAPASTNSNHAPLKHVVGLALSGGGVRSATFCLGVLQALAAKKRLRHIDYVSSVSGGGFTGSFLGRLFTRFNGSLVGDPAGRVEELLKEDRSGPIRWLRAQANYLFASGSDDWLTALGVFFRNVFAVHLALGALLLTFFGALAGIGKWPPYEKLISSLFGSSSQFGVELSPWWWVPLAMLALVIAPMKIGFWLAPKRMSYRSHPPHALGAWLVLVAGASVMLTLPGYAKWAGGALAVLGLSWIWQEVARRGVPERDVKQRQLIGRLVRNRLNRGLGEALVIFFVLVGWVALDSFALNHSHRRHLTELVAAVAALAPVLPMLRAWAKKLVSNGRGSSALTKMKLAAVVFALALLLLIDVIAHKLFSLEDVSWAWGALGVTLLFSLFLGRAFDFLNLTSLHAYYAARIIRTFLGASNDARTQGPDNIAADVQVTHPADDLPYHLYRPEAHGGPLHLISVCLNETVDQASQREIRERKGLLMTVGSFGVSVGRRFFARWSSPQIKAPRWQRFRRWLEGLNFEEAGPPALEPVRLNADPNTFHPLGRQDKQAALVQGLTLGDWVGISGAAFSTGQGRASNPLQTLFMGLCNLRLGFWWDSGIRASERPGRFPANLWRRIKGLQGQIFRVQNLLLCEWRARFGGPSFQFWNLTDGGHLDNSAVYELIRRRLPLIICCDATRDLKYTFADLASLVRDVRVDFGAEVEWKHPFGLELPEPANSWIQLFKVGTLDDLKGNPAQGGPGTKHAAIARITYHDDTKKVSWLLLLKASLAGDESLDVQQYAQAHPNFPQDSTSDQIYDDEQWESYRKLGYDIASAVILPPQP